MGNTSLIRTALLLALLAAFSLAATGYAPAADRARAPGRIAVAVAGGQRTHPLITVTGEDLSRSDDGFADASDPANILLGKFTRIYGVASKADAKVTFTASLA